MFKIVHRPQSPTDITLVVNCLPVWGAIRAPPGRPHTGHVDAPLAMMQQAAADAALAYSNTVTGDAPGQYMIVCTAYHKSSTLVS